MLINGIEQKVLRYSSEMGINLSRILGLLSSNPRELGALTRAFLLRKAIRGLGARLSLIETLNGGENVTSATIESATTLFRSQTVTTLHPRDEVEQIHTFSPKYLYTVENITLDTLTGIVFLPTGEIIEESSAWPKAHLVLNAIPRPPKKGLVRITNKKTVLLPSNGFYHWLIEDLPTFIKAYQSGEKPNVIMYNNAFGYVKNFSALLPSVVSVPRFVSVENYHFLSKGPDTGWPHPEEVATLRNYFAGNLHPTIRGKRVYISRLNSTRSPSFESVLIQERAKKGWKILETQNMSIKEQVTELSSAEVICGVHGAGLSGMIWMQEGSKVIELSPDKFIPCFARMSSVSRHEYLRVEIQEIDLHEIDKLVVDIEAFL